MTPLWSITYQAPATRTYLENSVSERDGLCLCRWPPATLGPAPPATTTLIGADVPPPGLQCIYRIPN